jgi:hypothetical protein
MFRRLLSAGHGSKKRLWITSALLAVFVLTPLTEVGNASRPGPHSSPLFLWILWTLIVVVVRSVARLWKRRVDAEAEAMLAMPQQPIWLHERLCEWLTEDRP